eukprot:4497999-Pyramimonas_sp.AAC.1
MSQRVSQAALTRGHFSARRWLDRARYHGHVDSGRHDDDTSDAGGNDGNDDGKADDGADADLTDDD